MHGAPEHEIGGVAYANDGWRGWVAAEVRKTEGGGWEIAHKLLAPVADFELARAAVDAHLVGLGAELMPEELLRDQWDPVKEARKERDAASVQTVDPYATRRRVLAPIVASLAAVTPAGDDERAWAALVLRRALALEAELELALMAPAAGGA